MLMGPAGLSLFEISLRQTMETSTHTVTSLCPYPLIFIYVGCGGRRVWLCGHMPLRVWADVFDCHDATPGIEPGAPNAQSPRTRQLDQTYIRSDVGLV